ncbi:MAG TPA: DEAD/DEAH box helicase family protein [Candidatus Saccharimonadales bacterium]|nr:DEAD/DEAH box helicase family protein [Candidatus Saccharimonadales bacterium]
MAIVVDEPIINSPFAEPTRHYRMRGGAAELVDARRPSGYMPGLRTRAGSSTLLEEEFVQLPLVNDIRGRVRRWRAAGYPGASRTTVDLLRHWQAPERERRLFFCQLEAAETAIWLVEGPLAETSRLPIEQQERYVRHALKMATGSGKTVVMAMLIAWSVLNKARQPQDRRYSDAVLVLCPNLTVKERLAVLHPTDPANYYEAFDLVPPGLRSALLGARVMVTNWHVLAVPDDARRRGVVQRGRPSAGAFANLVLRGELGSKGNLLVLNDEAHHAWRAGPKEERPERATRASAGEVATTARPSEDEEEARVWLNGLALINQARGINRAIDFSATPYYLSGSGHAEGEPFGWIVADFSLLDAIESGIVKVPRIPVDDNSGDPDPRYLDLWERVKGRLPKRPRGGTGSLSRDDRLLDEVEGALVTLASAWQVEFERWAAEGRLTPPAMIVVCDQTASAERIADYVGRGAVIEELANVSGEPDRTLRIDSALLAKAEEQLEAGQTSEQAAERLRKRVATVGKPGQPGADVRCVVSVAMLSEGWDAQNVTQILGLRAFSSQLLCEQVVGRGLRRASYDDMAVPEYVDVYGIPFQAFPVKGQRRLGPVDVKPQTLVQALRERAALELRFPRVVGYISDARFRISADVDGLPPLVVTPEVDPTWVKVGARGEGRGAVQDRDAFYAAHRLSRTVFEIAAKITDDLKFGDEQGRRIMFPQVLRIVRRYVETKVEPVEGASVEEIALGAYRSTIESRLIAAIHPADEEGEQPLLPVLHDMAGIGTTDVAPFLTVKPCLPTLKSQLSYAVFDSGWEAQVAKALDESARVRAWAKNVRLGFEIPYAHQGVAHAFVPDFLVELHAPDRDDRVEHLVVEVKGLEREQDRSKDVGAQRWIAAVNHWSKLGHWRYAKIHSPHQLKSVLG